MSNSIYPDIAIVEPVHYLTTSNQRQLIGLGYPLSTSGGGYFSKSYNTKLIANNIRQLILTERGERVMQPEFGLRFRSRVFEALDSVLIQQLKNEIQQGITTFLPIVKIVDLTVEEDTRPSSGDLGRVIIRLLFSLKDFPFEVNEVFVRA